MLQQGQGDAILPQVLKPFQAINRVDDPVAALNRKITALSSNTVICYTDSVRQATRDMVQSICQLQYQTNLLGKVGS